MDEVSSRAVSGWWHVRSFGKDRACKSGIEHASSSCYAAVSYN